MKLDEHDLHEFHTLYHQEFHEVLTDDEARAVFSRLLVLYELLVQPLPHERTSTLENAGHDAMLDRERDAPPMDRLDVPASVAQGVPSDHR